MKINVGFENFYRLAFSQDCKLQLDFDFSIEDNWFPWAWYLDFRKKNGILKWVKKNHPWIIHEQEEYQWLENEDKKGITLYTCT